MVIVELRLGVWLGGEWNFGTKCNYLGYCYIRFLGASLASIDVHVSTRYDRNSMHGAEVADINLSIKMKS